MNAKIGIIGGGGYTGGELIRLLVHHPYSFISFIHSRSHAGKPVASVHQDLVGSIDLEFSDKINNDIDVLFLCLGQGESKKFLDGNEIPEDVRIIDLSQDFRLSEQSTRKKRNFVYGLPELNRESIRSARNIANPGCFATCIQLGLLPLAKEGILKEIHTTGITGSTGAGQSLSPTTHFSWRANNLQAYKTLEHQHLKEIYQSLHSLQQNFPPGPGGNTGINFIPWRGDFTRGIFVSSQLSCDLSLQELHILYSEFYKEHPFTHISKDPIYLKQVVNTNNCFIQLEKVGTKVVVHTITDNLLKGASGQALQNMNLMLGLEENAGLKLKSIGF